MEQDQTFIDLFLRNWARIGGPIRPSVDEQSFFEGCVRKAAERENPEMLILGATPEFRDMGIRHGIKPVSADIVPPIFEAMKTFMEENGDEEFIHCDWLELPEDRKYDLILGDGALNVLSREGARKFFEKQAALLEDGARVVQRVLCRNESHTPELLQSAVRDYREKKLELPLFSYVGLLMFCVREYSYPDLGTAEMFEQVLCPQLTEEEIAGMKPFMFGGKTYMASREEVDQWIDGIFEIEDIYKYEAPGYWGMAKTLVMRKKV